MTKIDARDSSNGQRVSFSWGIPNSFGQNWALDSKGHPWNTLSETIKTAQNNANTLVVYAKDNPNVQRLLSGYEEWESNLRREAKKRLSGFTPLSPVLDKGLLSDDWDLLRRVKNSNSKLTTSGSMKRSASDNTIAPLVASRKSSRAKHSESGEGQVVVNFYPHHPPFGIRKSQSSVLPKVPTATSLEQLHQQAISKGEEAARTVESVVKSFAQSSNLALQNAQQTLQETATNCQQNFQTLTSMFQLAASGAIAGSAPEGLGSGLITWPVLPRYLRFDGGGSDTNLEHRDNAKLLSQFQLYIEDLEAKKRTKSGSLRDPGRQVAIVTTASLPWLTGTSVNPLLRAAYLAKEDSRKVTLVLPWLSKTDQERVFPNSVTFETPEDQEAFVREWAQKRTGLACNFKITFYPGRYAPEKGSILPVGDITQYIPEHEADIAVLEEPEHLNWYHHGRRWTDKFNHVVGVMHTNYLDYARREENGALKEAILKHVNAWVCRIHCHKVIKLSDAVQPLPREETMFVHGVSPSFLKVGEKKAEQAQTGVKPFSKGAYFLGKVVWAKGYTELLDRLKEHGERTGEKVHVDVYGSGPDLNSVVEEAGSRELDLKFNGARDHADESIHDYKVFINPSLSDVVATTTAEALAMGKFVVCADHPSNRFFAQFPNCLVYHNNEEFSDCLKKALNSEPAPLSHDVLSRLTWEAATERFLDVAHVKRSPAPIETLFDNALHFAHNAMTGIEFLRIAAGAGSKTKNAPVRITDYQPSDSDVGGLFDDKNRAKKCYSTPKF